MELNDIKGLHINGLKNKPLSMPVMDNVKGEKYWVKGNYQGRLFVDGPFNTSDEAWVKAVEWFNGDESKFKIVKLSTENVSAATRMLKHERLDETQNIGTALKRAKHII